MIYGPYTRKDKRQIIIVYGQTISYPKYFWEKYLGVKLKSNETIDHINNDFTDTCFCNLRILTRKQNSSSIYRQQAIYKCANCCKRFIKSKAKVRNHFCSNKCKCAYHKRKRAYAKW